MNDIDPMWCSESFLEGIVIQMGFTGMHTVQLCGRLQPALYWFMNNLLILNIDDNGHTQLESFEYSLQKDDLFFYKHWAVATKQQYDYL